MNDYDYRDEDYSRAAEERRARREARLRAAEQRQEQARLAETRRAERAQAAQDLVRSGQRAVREGAQRAMESAPQVGGGILEAGRANPKAVAAVLGAILVIALVVVGVSRCAAGGGQQEEPASVPVQQVNQADLADAAQAGAAGTVSDAQVASPVPAPAATAPAVQTINAATGLSMTASIAGVTPPEGYMGVECPWVEGGRYSTGDPVLDEYVKAWCDGQTKEGLDFSDNAYNNYLSIAWSDYVERDDNQNPSGVLWAYDNARSYYEHAGGNCYEFSAFLSFCMQYFGYSDAHAEPLLVLFESGAWGQHTLVYVTNHDGTKCLLDTARGANGWMLPVGSYTLQVDDIGQNIVDSFEYAQTTWAAEKEAAAAGAATAAGTSTTSYTMPDPSWKTAAGVAELTSQGTDPTAIAAQMEADRVAANLAAGYRGVEDPWVEGGLFTTGDAELDELVKAFCDSHSSPDLDFSDNAYNTFCNITWSDYVEWEGNQHPHTYDWTVGYAKDFFTRGGNCFSMAAAIQYCLRYFGYSDAHCELTYQERQSGLWLDHGLTWVTNAKTGEVRMVDSEQAANGWMMAPNSYNVEILDPTGDWEPRSSAYDVSEML